MNAKNWLKEAIEKLKVNSVPSARLDAEVLIADILEKDRSWIHTNLEYKLPNNLIKELNAQINRRNRHEPLAYIRGKQEFYGRDFLVTLDTLTPRPETETMLELLLEEAGGWRLETGEQLQVVDVGTGSGCIIISAALELSKVQGSRSKIIFSGLDISEEALKIAQKNADMLEAKVEFKKFDLMQDNLSPIFNFQSPVCILANLPYVPENYKINKAATHEPKIALFSGEDGLDHYRNLFLQLSKIQNPRSKIHVFTESLEFQHKELEVIARESGFKLQKSKDLIQVFKRSSSKS